MRPRLAAAVAALILAASGAVGTVEGTEDDSSKEATTPPSSTTESPWMGGGVGTTVREGEHALLTCVVRGKADRAVTWRRARDHLLLAAGKSTIADDDRIQVLHDDAEEPMAGGSSRVANGGEVWALVIRNAHANDSGLYVCELNSIPPVRSFHKLTVIPGALSPSLTPPEIGATDSYASNGRTPSLSARIHNYTDCCVASNVSHGCLGYCSIQAILDGSTGQEPENCENEFGLIVRCMADSRNHVPCCIQERVPDICQDVCRGEYTPITDNIKTHFSCAAYTDQTLACIVEGIEILPSCPEEIDVISLNEKSVNISWSTPLKNGGTVTEYMINITTLRTFDAHLETHFDSLHKDGNKAQIRSISVKVPSDKNSTVINDLVPFTMYEVTVTSLNIHGSSLPSNAVRILTKTPSKARVPGEASMAPPLPDVKQCCTDNGVSHHGCLGKLCDPTHTHVLDVTELMICAPWAPAAFGCLANGMDHTPCCKTRGMPDICLSFCSGNITTIDFNYFKCIRHMPEYSNCLLQGYGVLPSAPLKVHATNVATDYAIIHWSPPMTLADTVLHYNLQYRRLDKRDDDAYHVIEMVTSPYILDNIASNTDYEVFVEAQNEHGTGEASARLIFRTQSVTDEELDFDLSDGTSPYNVTACCENAGISTPCMELCTYDASMSRLRTLAGVCTSDFHKLLRCGAGGRDHTQCCRRRGVPTECESLCAGAMSPKKGACLPYIGNVIMCFEEGTGNLPGPPRELHATSVTDSSVVISWNHPDDGQNATSYTVHYQQADNISAVMYTELNLDNQMNVNENFAEIVTLKKGHIYHIFVVANNEHGASLPSSVLVINVTKQELGPDGIKGVPSPPHSLALSGHSATWVTISWQPPLLSQPEDKMTYTLYYKPTGNSSFTAIKTTVISHTLEKLSPNSQYIVYVTVTAPSGTSAPSETLVAWTDPAYPAFVEPPTVHPVNLVVEGSSMTILCIAMGTPMPTISLYISGRLVRQDITRHMVTIIHNVTRDMDQISCYADNGYGTPMQATRKVTISHPPSIQASGITMAAAGDSVVLECRVESLPRPQVAFWRDPQGRVPVIQGPKYNIELLQDNEGDSKYTMRLTINKLSEPDEGDYFCHAENAFGFAVRPVSVRLRPETHTAAALNVTDCCVRQNVSTACMDACGIYLDMDEVMDRTECISDFDKLMRCAADGSDHRGCCANAGVPRPCLELCRGGNAPRTCALQHARRALACFRAQGPALPGPPTVLLAIPGPTASSVIVSWKPPIKNPDTVEVYRVFWREVGGKSPNRLDTADTHATLADLKDGVTYECVVKAGNHIGTSSLTEPIQFTAGAVGAEGAMGSSSGAVVGGVLACLLGAVVLAAAVYLYRRHKNLRLKSQGGVAFENPSYLREGNTDIISNGNGTTTNGVSNATPASANATSVSNSAGWRQESLHTPQEVNPSLYEELKLGHDGAGFKRLK